MIVTDEARRKQFDLFSLENWLDMKYREYADYSITRYGTYGTMYCWCTTSSASNSSSLHRTKLQRMKILQTKLILCGLPKFIVQLQTKAVIPSIAFDAFSGESDPWEELRVSVRPNFPRIVSGWEYRDRNTWNTSTYVVLLFCTWSKKYYVLCSNHENNF